MKLIITIAIALMLLLPQAVRSASLDYEQYKVEKIYDGKSAAPDLATHKKASEYQTILRTQSKSGPNFAGHFTFVTIGCGTSCARIAIIDSITGHVYFADNVRTIFWAGWWHDKYGPEFKITSRLLVVYGQVNSEDAPYGISYFEWTGQEFKLLKFEAKDRGKPPTEK